MRFGITLREVGSTSIPDLWSLIGDTEAQTRQAFLATLTVDVVNALTSLKVRLPHLSASCRISNLWMLGNAGAYAQTYQRRFERIWQCLHWLCWEYITKAEARIPEKMPRSRGQYWGSDFLQSPTMCFQGSQSCRGRCAAASNIY